MYEYIEVYQYAGATAITDDGRVIGGESVMKVVTEYASKGWRLVSVVPQHNGGNILYFERPTFRTQVSP